jgi:serine/threonine protein kinase
VDYFSGFPYCTIVSPLWGHPWLSGEQRKKKGECTTLPKSIQVETSLDIEKQKADKVLESMAYLMKHLPLAPSRDLFACIDSRIEPLPENLAKDIFSKLVEAVYDVRQCHIFHNDIKDENILVDPSYNIKLIDFGASAFLTSPKRQYCGTLIFASPEMFLPGKNRDPSIQEIWSLGCVLYLMLTGKHYAQNIETVAFNPDLQAFLKKNNAFAAFQTDTQNLLKSCLSFNASNRITIDNLISLTHRHNHIHQQQLQLS